MGRGASTIDAVQKSHFDANGLISLVYLFLGEIFTVGSKSYPDYLPVDTLLFVDG